MNALSLLPFTALLTTSLCSHGALIGKCINHREDKVTFNCPRGHVIYRPIFYAGVSNSSTCSFQDGDCVGLTGSLLTQRNKCYWRQTCSLRWRSKVSIVTSEREECMGKLANYVNYENPTCILRGDIYDICSADDYSIKSLFGVIRSHSDYPWTYDGMHRTCRRTLKPRSGHTLSLTLDDLDTSDSDFLTIRHAKMDSDDTLLYSVRMAGRKHWHITEGFVEIKFTAASGVKSSRGFVLQFEQLPGINVPRQRANHNPSDLDMRKASLFSNSQFKHHLAAVDECITSKEKRTSLHCPAGHVIYKPELQVGISNVHKCTHTAGDCMGMTHTLLTQRNKCYWRNNCDLSWRSGIPITLSTTPTCLALPPDYISLSGFTCVPEDQVFNICDKREVIINATYGLIISHQYYPWHYDSKKTVCRKRLQIHRKLGLRMSSEDFDLDPDSRKDNVKIFTVSETGKRRPLKKFMRNQNVSLAFTEGCVDVEFRVDRNSKSGRGFVIKLEPLVPGTDVGSGDVFVTCPGFNKRHHRGHRTKSTRAKNHRRAFTKSKRRKTHRRRNKPRKLRNRRKGRRYRSNKFNQIHNIN